MTIELVNENLLLQISGAILLSIDGHSAGMEGNIARSFAYKNPDMWDEIEHEIDYPLTLGQSQLIEIDEIFDCQFSHCILASTLNHLTELTKNQKFEIIKSCLTRAILLAASQGIPIINTALLTGGWRVTPSEAH